MRPVARLTTLLALLLGALVLLAGAPASAADDVPTPEPGAPWFGPGLDWTEDSAAAYAERLGETPSLYSQRVNYPLSDDDTTYLRQFAGQAAAQGAVAVVSLEPTVALPELTEADADELGGELAKLHDELDQVLLVRFAPEMNGSWYGWGQQPTQYVAAFRTVADAVHAATPYAAMVWSPVYGAGYPFGAAYGDVDPDREGDTTALDTDGNGVLDGSDDPYGPYWPGKDAVDWVGITMYHFGVDRGREDNDLDPTTGGATGDDELSEGFEPDVAPEPGDVEARLDETYGYGDEGTGREPFYDRFAKRHDLPVLLETAALWRPDGKGDPEIRIKQGWWRQVFAATDDYPLIGGISWLEQKRPEAEVQGDDVDWRATRTDRLSEALRDDLADARVDIGPVTRVLDQQAANEATAQGRLPGEDDSASGGGEMGWIVFCAALLAVAFVVAGFVGRFVPSWRYPHEHDPRDQRLDLFRGWIILTVVLTHTELTSPYSYVSLNAIGAITGAEMFVLLSGIVLGMIYAPTVRKLGEWRTAVVMWKRARKQYLVAISVILIIFLVGLLPFVDATAITTFTDRGTGENGEQVQGQVYDLYANGPRLFDYPTPWYAVKQLLLLEMGPWVFNIMGLFVVLSLLLPPMMWLVRRGLWWVLLALSWAAFIGDTLTDLPSLPSQFDDVFPLWTWQICFTHGLVVGHYRRQLTAALTTRWGKAACTVFVLGYAGILVYLWAGHAYDFVPTPFSATTYDWLYLNAYTRIFLQPGRLLDLVLMVIVAFAFLTTCWKPVNAVVGWFWTPLGAASLYVFIVHVFFVLAIANIPGLDRGSFWQGTVIHTVEILLIWLMVKKRFLFSVIPR